MVLFGRDLWHSRGIRCGLQRRLGFAEVAARLKDALLLWNAAMPKDAGDPSFAPAKDR